jgi:putative membrane protein
MKQHNGDRNQLQLIALFAVFFVVSCISPPYPRELILQHVPTVLFLLVLVVLRGRLGLSQVSLLLVLAFMAFHLLGARYLYSFVPYDRWTTTLFGGSVSDWFGFTRNHYDRLVHFAYGLLVAFPAREVFARQLKWDGPWSWCLAVQFVVATSGLYEIVEWGVAMSFAPDWAEQYNGQQGDMWDSQKDMALATAGSLVSVMIGRHFTPPPPGNRSLPSVAPGSRRM